MATLITGSGVDKVIDGSITSTKIADGTITSTKIADGTITNADINASAGIAGSKVDGSFGKVLQVVSEACPTDDNETTSSTMTASKMQVTITTSKVNSKLLVTMTPFIRHYNDASHSARFAIRSSVDSYASDLVGHDQFISTTGGWVSSNGGAYQYLHSPNQPAGTVITYKLYFAKTYSGGSQPILINSSNYWGYGQTKTESVIMEIEA